MNGITTAAILPAALTFLKILLVERFWTSP